MPSVPALLLIFFLIATSCRLFDAFRSVVPCLLPPRAATKTKTPAGVHCYQQNPMRRGALLPLGMGKGLNKARNKQAALKQKLEQAKRQKQNTTDDTDSETSKSSGTQQRKLTEQEIRERNDRLRFEELLQKRGSITNLSDDGYLNARQEEEEINAVRAGIDRIFEGDPAPTDCFEELVNIKSENAIGSTGKQRLVPWLRQNAKNDDYLVIITDPRPQSPELRDTVKLLLSDLPSDIRSRLVIVNSDSPAENRRWLKKSRLLDKDGSTSLNVYSDEKKEWMRAYTALGETRWSMSMFIIANGRVAKLARDMDQYGASLTVRNAVKSLTTEARLS